MTFPAQATTGSAARRPAYISKSIASLSFSINGGAPTILNAPRPTGSPQTVTSTVDAPPGTDTFAIAEYDSTDGVGNLLGRTIQTRSIVAGTINNIGFTLDGQLAKIAIQSVPDPFVEGSIASGITLVGAAPHAFVAIPQDADGNTIVMPGAVPKIAVASANASAIVAATGDGNTFTLAAPAPTGPIAISVSATDLDGKTVSAAPLQTRALGAFYIADFTVQLIRAFDENGTPLALAPTAFANVTNPEGLAYIPGSPGTIVVTESANPGAPYVVAYDLAGTRDRYRRARSPGSRDRSSSPTRRAPMRGSSSFQITLPTHYRSSMRTATPSHWRPAASRSCSTRSPPRTIRTTPRST